MVRRRSGGMVPRQARRSSGASSSMNSDRKAMVVRARMVENTALPRFVADAEGRLPQVLGGRLQLGGVALHPGQEVEALEGVGQRARGPSAPGGPWSGSSLGEVGQTELTSG